MAFQIVIIFPINTQNIYLIAEKKRKRNLPPFLRHLCDDVRSLSLIFTPLSFGSRIIKFILLMQMKFHQF